MHKNSIEFLRCVKCSGKLDVDILIETNEIFEGFLVCKNCKEKFPIINGIYLKFRFKSKFLYEIRDVWPKSIIELRGISKNNIFILFLKMLDYLGLKYSDIILSPLNNIKLYVKEKNIQNKECIFLPNGISNIRSNKISLRNKDKFVVGYAGNLSDNNSIMNLIDAAIILKDNNKIIFKVIGNLLIFFKYLIEIILIIFFQL